MISSVARKAIAGLASNSFLGQRIRTLGRDPAFPEWPSYRASERWTPDNAVEVTNGAGGVVRISKVETPVDGVVVRLTIILRLPAIRFEPAVQVLPPALLVFRTYPIAHST